VKLVRYARKGLAANLAETSGGFQVSIAEETTRYLYIDLAYTARTVAPETQMEDVALYRGQDAIHHATPGFQAYCKRCDPRQLWTRASLGHELPITQM
jgi:hypothetical protein